jgi:ABC-2 type transport system permease protein
LPLNFRGFVALKSEAEITSILNRYAEDRMHEELRQSFFARQFGWLSPQVALRTLSMLTAGTGLETHHRFLRETENLRFNFVQRLNQAHTNKLNYIDDMNRNKSEAAGQIARISAKNWNVIEGFKFRSSPSKERALQAMTPLAQLLLWFGMFGLFLRNLQRHYS